MFELWKKDRKLKGLEYDLEIEEKQLAIKAVTQLLEKRNIVVDDEMDGWTLLGTSSTSMTEDEHGDMQEQAYKFYHTNPHARAIIRGLVKFVLGVGPDIIPDDENEKVKEAWVDFKRANRFNQREKEIATRTFRDGEVFKRKFVDTENGDMKVRFIRCANIGKPKSYLADDKWSHGIETNPEDIEEPLNYMLLNKDGDKKEVIPAEEMIHIKILADSDQKRGISLLRVCAKRLKQYDGWLEDRIALNAVRGAIALIRTVEGPASKVKDLRDENLSDNYSETKKLQKVMKRGTIITASRGVEYKMESPNINASDVGEDGRAMLLSIAAGVGMPEMIFTADYSNSNYASSLVAQNPFVRDIEDWQDFFSTFYEELFKDVIEAKVKYGDLPAETKTTCRVEFPPMITADLEKLAKAYEILRKYKGLSIKTWQSKMGLDPDVETANMDNEDEEDFLPAMPGQPGQQKSPFNLPMSPQNQWGQAILKAAKEKDWDKLTELAEQFKEVEEE